MRRERGDNEEHSGISKWIEQTPAQAAAGLTDHRWRMEELMSFVVVPREMSKRRGRRPKWLMEEAVTA